MNIKKVFGIGFNVVFQTAATVVQVGNQALDIVPEKYKAPVALVVGLAQAVVAWNAHYKNPNGESAKLPYEKEEKGTSLNLK